MKSYIDYINDINSLTKQGFPTTGITSTIQYTYQKPSSTIDLTHSISHDSTTTQSTDICANTHNAAYEAQLSDTKAFFQLEGKGLPIHNINIGANYEHAFDNTDDSYVSTYIKFIAREALHYERANYSTQFKLQSKRLSILNPSLEWQNLFYYKDFYIGNYSLYSNKPNNNELLLSYSNGTVLAYVMHSSEDCINLGKLTTGATYQHFSKNGSIIKCGCEVTCDMKKPGEYILEECVAGKYEKDHSSVQLMLNSSGNVSWGITSNPYKSFRFTIGSSIKLMSAFKPIESVNAMKYGISMEWNI